MSIMDILRGFSKSNRGYGYLAGFLMGMHAMQSALCNTAVTQHSKTKTTESKYES